MLLQDLLNYITYAFQYTWIGSFNFWFALISIGAATWLLLKRWSKKQYPLQVILRELRGDTFWIRTDVWLGKWKTPEGLDTWIFKKGPFGLRRKGETMEPQHYQYVSRSAEALGVVDIVRYGSGQHKVIDPRTVLTDGKFTIIDIDDWNWRELEHRATSDRRAKKLDKWEKMLPIMGVGLCVIMVIAVCWLSYNLIRDLTDKVTAATQALATAEGRTMGQPIVGGGPPPEPAQTFGQSFFKTG